MRTVLITGITGGIGCRLADLYLKRGYKVFGTCSHNSKSLQQFQMKWPSIEVFQVDHDDLTNVRNVYSNFFRKVKPQIIINNAGIVKDSFLVQMQLTDFQKVLTVNLTSAWIVVKEFLQQLDTNDTSKYRIINISSISGLIGREGQCNYALTKGGLIGLSRLIEHLKQKHQNIDSYVIAPGLINTGIKDKMPQKKIANLKNNTLAKRLGTPEEVAKFIVKLSEPDISYCDGTVYRIDGGILK